MGVPCENPDNTIEQRAVTFDLLTSFFAEMYLIKPLSWTRLRDHATARQLRHEVLNAPLDSILHPSQMRLKWLGAFTLIGHPLFYWIWHVWLPQPYENLPARCSMGLLGTLLMLGHIANAPARARTQHLFNAICFVQLPLFFSWMYAMNGHNAVWLASLATVTLIYYHLTDWRIAATGSFAGFLLGTSLAGAMSASPLPAQPQSHLVTLGFAWVAGLLLGFSGANLRRERLGHSLATIGIMAHELRTPLSTAALIADALLMESSRFPDAPRAGQLAKLGQRLHTLARSMNHHIDLQISNARLLQLPPYRDRISAGELVSEAIAAYPFRTSRERDCLALVIHNDFWFQGSKTQFLRVLDNLVHNALRALQAAGAMPHPGDLRIEVGSRGREGRITVSDRGIGISPAMQLRIFEPFFSTDRGAGHGLGLAFCKQVVLAAHGTIRVKSEPAAGAIFTIALPVEAGEALPPEGEKTA